MKNEGQRKNDSRVVVTGMGVITPIGQTPSEYFESLMAGRSGIRAWKAMDKRVYSKIGGDLSEFDPDSHLGRVGRHYPSTVVAQAKKLLRVTPPSGRINALAALQAYAGAGLYEAPVLPERFGHVLAGHNLNHSYILQNHTEYGREPDYIDPLYCLLVYDTDVLAVTSELVNAKGPTLMVGNACASGNMAMLNALDLIRAGRADTVLVSAPLGDFDPVLLQGFALIDSVAVKSFNDQPSRASRPFDKRREGFVPGCGAGAVLLERLSQAKKRRAQIHAEILGAASSSAATRLAKPIMEGQVRAMQGALREAGVNPEEVNYVNAHATSTPLGDAVEVAAIKTVFGDHAYKLPVNSTKSMLGHCLTASGILEVIATILQMQHEVVHPTINQEEPDPELDLDFVPNHAREHHIHIALSNAFGFGGLNSCVVIGPPP